MKYNIYIAISILLLYSVSSASYWVQNPANCPITNATVFPGQDCSPNKICGDSSTIAQCYDTSTISAPGSMTTSNTDQDSGGCRDATCDGGYILNCFATADSTDPKCDNSGNLWCDRNSTCYTTKVRDTNCTASLFGASVCGNCRTGYQDCTGNDVCEVTTGTTNYPTGANNNYGSGCSCACDSGYGDCDSGGCSLTDGCETQFGTTSCASGANNNIPSCGNCVCDSGYQDCDSSGAGVGNGCEVQTSVTGCTMPGGAPGVYGASCACLPTATVDVLANIFNESWGTSYIWGKQTNPEGALINMTTASDTVFLVDYQGCIVFPDGTRQCSNVTSSTTTNPFDQELNTTSNVSFRNLTLEYICNATDCFTLTELNLSSMGLFNYNDYFDQNLNTTDNVTYRNITVEYLCNGTNCFTLSDLNSTVLNSFTYSEHFNQYLNTTNNVTFANVTIDRLCNGTSCFTLTELNATSAGGSDNSSWNETLANRLYLRTVLSNTGSVTTATHNLTTQAILSAVTGTCGTTMLGAGTITNPCNITNCTELQNMNVNKTAYYQLVNNIDCSDTINWNTGAGFLPIGGMAAGTAFNGSFNGKYYNISSIYIKRDGTTGQSLLGGIGSNGTFVNVHLINFTVYGNHYTSCFISALGWIVSDTNYIQNISCINSYLNSTGQSSAGIIGIINKANGIIDSIVFKGIINQSGGTGFTSGLVGMRNAALLPLILNNSYSIVNMSINSNYAAGLFGSPNANVTIMNSYTDVVMFNKSSSFSNYGGISALIANNSIFSNLIAISNFTTIPSTKSTGLIGTNTSNMNYPIFNCHILNNSDTVRQCVYLDSVGSSYSNVNCTIQTDITYFYNKSNAPMSSWDFTTVWKENANSYPTLRWEDIVSSSSTKNTVRINYTINESSPDIICYSFNGGDVCFNQTNLTSGGGGSTVNYINTFDQSLNTTDNVTFKNITLDYLCNGTACFKLSELNTTGVGSSGNPFNQSLNTTDIVKFQSISAPNINSEVGYDTVIGVENNLNDTQAIYNGSRMILGWQNNMTGSLVAWATTLGYRNSLVATTYTHVIGNNINADYAFDSVIIGQNITASLVYSSTVIGRDIDVSNADGDVIVGKHNATMTVTDGIFMFNQPIYTPNICYSDGTNCTAGVGGNPFDQSLNTTDNVTFKNVTLDYLCDTTGCYNLSDLNTTNSSVGNPFDQSLNTTDLVGFQAVNFTNNSDAYTPIAFYNTNIFSSSSYSQILSQYDVTNPTNMAAIRFWGRNGVRWSKVSLAIDDGTSTPFDALSIDSTGVLNLSMYYTNGILHMNNTLVEVDTRAYITDENFSNWVNLSGEIINWTYSDGWINSSVYRHDDIPLAYRQEYIDNLGYLVIYGGEYNGKPYYNVNLYNWWLFWTGSQYAIDPSLGGTGACYSPTIVGPWTGCPYGLNEIKQFWRVDNRGNALFAYINLTNNQICNTTDCYTLQELNFTPDLAGYILNQTYTCDANYVVNGIQQNGTPLCTPDQTLAGGETDPLWSSNLTEHNNSWSSIYNSSYEYYLNSSLITDENYSNWVNVSGLIINWSVDVNSSGLIINWSYDDTWINSSIDLMIDNNTIIKDYNFSNWANASGLIINWSSSSSIESDPLWTANESTVCRLDGTNCPAAGNEADPLWTANSTLYVKKSGDIMTGHLNMTNSANITLDDGSYLMGQPLTGMLGSGLILSVSETGSKVKDINLSCAGLVCRYNNFTVRIMQGTAASYAKYCNIPNGSLNVPDNTFAAYYIDSNCAVQQTTYSNWFTTVMKNGGAWDFAYILSQNGAAEVTDSISLEQRRMMKQRVLNYYTQQAKVISGFSFKINTGLSFNITAGKTVFGMDVVDVNQHVVNDTNNHIETVGNSGTGWQYDDMPALNISWCSNGTAVITCTGANYRRTFIFSIGYDDGALASELHATYPLEFTSYTTLAQCMDTTTYPLSYSLPTNYEGAAVMLYAYCAKRTDSSLVSTQLIDLRSTKTGVATAAAETDPIWTADKVNYYTSTQDDIIDSSRGNWTLDKPNYFNNTMNINISTYNITSSNVPNVVSTNASGCTIIKGATSTLAVC